MKTKPKGINFYIRYNQDPGKEAKKALEKVYQIDQVLGVLSLQNEEAIPEDLLEVLAKRQKAREEKNWTVADECRAFIAARGYKIEDSPQGAKLKRNKV